MKASACYSARAEPRRGMQRGHQVKAMIARIAVSIVILLGCGTQLFAEQMVLFPDRYTCSNLLELESLEVDPQGKITFAYTPESVQLLTDYKTTIGWLQGYFTAWNALVRATHGNLTKGTRIAQWMTWIFNYCRAHPSGNLLDAANEFGTALLRKPN